MPNQKRSKRMQLLPFAMLALLGFSITLDAYAAARLAGTADTTPPASPEPSLSATAPGSQDFSNAAPPYSNPSQFTVFPVNQLSVFATQWDLGLMTQVDLTLANPDQPDLSQWTQSIRGQFGGALPGQPNVLGGIGGRLITPAKDSVAVASFFTTDTGSKTPASIQEAIALSPNATPEYDVSLPSGLPSALSYQHLTTALLSPKLDAKTELQKQLISAQMIFSGNESWLQLIVLDSSFDRVAELTQSVTALATGRIDIGAGDLDGDGLEEIVTIHQQSSNTWALTAFSLDITDEIATIQQIDRLLVHADNELARSLAVGDFDYDYVNEIAVLSIDLASSDAFRGQASLRAFYMNAANKLTAVGDAVKLGAEALIAPNADVAAGLFYLDPALNNPLLGRQLGSAFVNDNGYLQLFVHKLNVAKTTNSFTAEQLGNWSGQFDGFNPVRPTQGPVLAAGNFKGAVPVNGSLNPTLQIAVAAAVPQGLNPDTTASPQMYIFDVDQGAISGVDGMPIALDLGSNVKYVNAITLFPADFEGKSLYLGTPIHLQVEQLVDPRYIIQSPPKHVDFLPQDPSDPNSWNNPSTWEIVNVSAFPNFYVELATQSTGTVSTKSTDSASSETSASTTYDLSIDASAAFAGFSPFKISASYSDTVANSAKQSQTVMDYSTTTWSTRQSCQTSYWDQLVGFHRSLDIWRYPLYSLPGDGTNPPDLKPYLEIVLPGPVTSGPNDQQDGIAVSWYQPEPIINYLISYPSSLPNEPPDLGKYTYVDKDGKTVTETGWIGQWQNSVLGNAKTVALDWSQESGSSAEKSFEATYSESRDLKVGFSASRAFGFVTFAPSAGVSFNWTKKSSWSQSTLSSSKLATSQGITLKIPVGNVTGANGYQMSTGVYFSQHGELKVVHAASIPDGSMPWWYPRYGSRPDPGLNLPKRLVRTGPSTWVVQSDPAQSQQMRGLIIQYAEPNPLTGELEYVGMGIAEGDSLVLTATIYNLSIGQAVENLEVRFAYQRMEPNGQTKIGSPVTIDTVTIPKMEPQQTVGAQISWNVSGLAGEYLRIYVTVDPNDSIKNEIHELGALASNNVGYWPPGAAIRVFSPDTNAFVPTGSDVYTEEASLGLLNETGTLTTDLGEVKLFQMQQVVATFYSTHSGREHRIVEFYEGNPESGGNLFATQIARGVVEGTNHVVADWFPDDASVNEIWFRVLESRRERLRGNAAGRLPVRIEAGP